MSATMKLGRLPARQDPRTLQLPRYMVALPRAPRAVDYASKVSAWPMYANDRMGNCTCATAGHRIQAWMQYAEGLDVRVAEHDVIAAYRAISGYDPTTGANDNGAVELDVLKFWRKHGIGGHHIAAFAAVRPHDLELVRQAAYLFGGLYLGVALPATAQDQEVWDVVDPSLRGASAPGSWGGHAVDLVAYDEHGVTVVTWGALKKMTWAFWRAYVDEAWAILTQDWITDTTLRAPVGFDFAQLHSDLERVAGGTIVRADLPELGPVSVEVGTYAEIGALLAPLLADFFAGKAQETLVADARAAALAFIGQHLLVANGAVALANARAAKRAILSFFDWMAEGATPVDPTAPEVVSDSNLTPRGPDAAASEPSGG